MKNGFSLIELMITVAIVGILAMIAIPSYSAYVRRANRTDATRTLTFDSQALERCYSQAFTYAGCATALAGTKNSPQGYYNITIAVPSAANFLITAQAIAEPQLSDTPCFQFTVDNSGTQKAFDSSSSPTTPQTCWGST